MFHQVHDRRGVEEATARLLHITTSGQKFSVLFRIFLYGCAATCVGPFAFGARLIDLPVAFMLGTILGVLQLVVAPRSDLYANVFEVVAAVVTSFLARAFGSINGGNTFCFSALAQASIALILPGYIVLCASLELQSKSIVAGSVRMVYAVIYSLFLGFGITIGTTMYGLLDDNATSATTCQSSMPSHWAFFFVPGFALCLTLINQAKWKQAPVMVITACAGYFVSYWSSKRLNPGHSQISSTLGALVVGIIANLYSRLGNRFENYCLDIFDSKISPRFKAFRKFVFGTESRHASPSSMEQGAATEKPEEPIVARARKVGYSLAATIMLPAVFILVPGGLSANGSLVASLATANDITRHGLNSTLVVSSSTLVSKSAATNSLAFIVAGSVIQIAIGITVGLFLSAIVVYPVGKRRSGLFAL